MSGRRDQRFTEAVMLQLLLQSRTT